MLPLYDTIPYRRFPAMNWTLIVLCGLAFFAQLRDEKDGRDQLVEKYGMIPARVAHPERPITIRERGLARFPEGVREVVVERRLAPLEFSPWWTLLTCCFLHGGWAHVIGNLWMLHIFGDNVEDCFGKAGYAIFYVVCGIAASLLHLLTNWGSTIPTIGASGAIAGVMGAYLVLYPRAQVVTLIPIFVVFSAITVPAYLFLGFWFAMQFFSGVASIGSAMTGGVAWWAHIGGFAMGALIALELKRLQRVRPQTARRVPDNEAWRFRQRLPR